MRTPFHLNRGPVSADEWLSTALSVAERHGRLVTLWATQARTGRFTVSAVYDGDMRGLVWVDLLLEEGQTHYPEIASLFPCASRMQRAVADLLGLQAEGSVDRRPWLNHGEWPENFFPLRREFTGMEVGQQSVLSDYAFVPVTGDGVHEIAVGPVHAGIIEPGHFRFSVVGEKTLRLEERLGYAHKGIDKGFERFSALEGYRLAGRMSGDSSAAYSWSYCMALESIWDWHIPARALWLRAMALERERVANHLGDLGGIGNDAGFSFGLSQFMRLKEDLFRLNRSLFGHRFAMDYIKPGGVSTDIDKEKVAAILAQCDEIEREVSTLRAIYDDHAGLQDRFLKTGIVSPELATRLGLTGLAGRASGVVNDVRVNCPSPPYTEIEVNISGRDGGDVAARAAVRFDEIFESLRLIRLMCDGLPDGAIDAQVLDDSQVGFGAGWVEGWRGGIFVALEVEEGGRIARCHVHDPSWQNWPVVEYAVIGDIVPDFPLINKSFNLSYSGHDR